MTAGQCTSDEELKRKLTPQQYEILRRKGTEKPFTGGLLYNKKEGKYLCAACGNELFSSDAKYDSGSGWPSFWAPIARDSINESEDDSIPGRRRTELTCSRCGSHLGHVFDDGPQPTGQRYCINSLSLEFKENENTEQD